jgi:Spy/CpxP family protein refolding chaperone
MKRLFSLLVAVVVLAAPSMTQQFRLDGRGAGPLLERLALTDQQKTQFEQLQADHIKFMIDQNAKVASAGVDLRVLLRAESPQRASIEKKMKEIAELRTQQQMARIGHWFAVQKILTPDQQKVWKSVLDRPARRQQMDRSPRMMHRGGRGAGLREGPEGPPMDR